MMRYLITKIKQAIKPFIRGRLHCVCRGCYDQRAKQGLMREPVELPFPYCVQETCCFCGGLAFRGIYVRIKGQRCRCKLTRIKLVMRLDGAAGTAKRYYVKGKAWFLAAKNGHATISPQVEAPGTIAAGDPAIHVETDIL